MKSELNEYLALHDRLLVIDSPEHCISLCQKEFGGGFYFRGMNNVDYDLVSSLDRADAAATHYKYSGDLKLKYREQWFFREFRKVAHNYLSSNSLPSTRLEWLALMQHHGIPTRLVDITRSPFVALYFAVRDWQSKCDAVVWIIGAETLHRSSHSKMVRSNFPFSINDPKRYENEMQEFLEDEYFEEAFYSQNYDIALILKPNWSSARLAAQQGAFLVTSKSGVNKTSILMELLSDDSFMDAEERDMMKRHKIDVSLRKMVIPAKHKKRILRDLNLMNISASTLFPGLDGLCQGISEQGHLENWDSRID